MPSWPRRVYIDCTAHRYGIRHVFELTPRGFWDTAWWAKPSPSAAEIMYARSQEDDIEKADSAAAGYTFIHDETWVEDAVAEVAKLYRQSGADRLLLVGFSNGAIVASAAAIHLGAAGLWLASGAPTPDQQISLPLCRTFVILTAGWYEEFFGGHRGLKYAIAGMPDDRLRIIDFVGGHLQEPPEVTDEAVNLLVSKFTE